jgi:hypothetical protein
MLVKVWTEVSSEKYVSLLAKIIEYKEDKMMIRYLSPTTVNYKGKPIYTYEDTVYEVDDDYIIEYLEGLGETDLGFRDIEGGYIKLDSDDDYVPSEDESSCSEDTDNYVDE